MKNFILALPLLLGSGCGALSGAYGDAKDLVTNDAPANVTPAEQATADAAGGTVGTIVTLGTGNPAIGTGVGALVTGAIVFFMKRRKK